MRHCLIKFDADFSIFPHNDVISIFYQPRVSHIPPQTSLNSARVSFNQQSPYLGMAEITAEISRKKRQQIASDRYKLIKLLPLYRPRLSPPQTQDYYFFCLPSFCLKSDVCHSCVTYFPYLLTFLRHDILSLASPCNIYTETRAPGK